MSVNIQCIDKLNRNYTNWFKEEVFASLPGYFSENNWYKFDDLQNCPLWLETVLCLSMHDGNTVSECFAFSNQGQTYSCACLISFIFQSLLLTGQEHDSTKNEIKIEAESQGSYMETEGIETRMPCYLRMRWNYEPWLLSILVFVRSVHVCFRQWLPEYGNSVLLCVPLKTWRRKRKGH